MSRLPVDGVLFDVDDTLVDTRGAFRAAFAAVADRYLPPLPSPQAAERTEAMTVLWRADPGGHYRAYTRGEETFGGQRVARANELHAAFGGPVLDDAGFADWDLLFDGAFQDAWAPHPEASAVVDRLRAAGLAVGAVSNATVAYQVAKLAATGLGDRVPMLVGVDTLGVGKPHPSVFAEGCRLLRTQPARTVYVGDELDIDAVAASAAGLLGVWLDRPGGRRVPVGDDEVAAAGVPVLADLAGLPALLGLAG